MTRVFHHQFTVPALCGIVLAATLTLYFFWQKMAIAGVLVAGLWVLMTERVLHTTYTLTDAERENWNFVPIARQGLPFKKMSTDQHGLEHRRRKRIFRRLGQQADAPRHPGAGDPADEHAALLPHLAPGLGVEDLQLPVDQVPEIAGHRLRVGVADVVPGPVEGARGGLGLLRFEQARHLALQQPEELLPCLV